ncbi:uncharacterized protein LOC110737466 [Chenopodium quinoa]|uniref:uncharacterized protein LOC110737466 n=1 Tax=Chenopodium quinoa TaxID=63459 RepID=UPI000B784294|nr:uncharacterized protein LOC110737466 [Chenopodium quinoa]
MPPRKNSDHNTDDTEAMTAADLQKLESSLRSLLDEQCKTLNETNSTNNLNISQNTKSIYELHDLMVGLSVQVTKLIYDVNSPIKTPVKTLDTSEPGQKNYSQYSSRLTKINFPKFDGDDLKSWLYKCNQFFDLDGISDENKISLAVIHLEGRALLWHQNFMKNTPQCSWTEYVAGITARFGEIYDDPIAGLKALKQTGTIQEYHDAFDALASRLNLSQEYLISCYIGGLEEEIQLAVRMFSPTTIQQSHCLAKLQEAAHKARKPRPQTKPLLPTPPRPFLSTQGSPSTWRGTNSTYNKPNTNQLNTKPNTTRQTLTAAEMNEKRAKGLCFWCNEKYEFGHQCKGKKPQFYHIEVGDDSDEEGEHNENENEMDAEAECAQISLQALDGNTTFHTMRMMGQFGRKSLHILLDSGSTHNFIDTSTALKSQCKVENMPPRWVKVADGGRIKCDAMIKGFTWKMQGYTFTADLLLLPLSGSNMVLGIQWFSTLGPILWDFKNLTMEFKLNQKKVKLRGATNKKLKGIQADQLSKLLQRESELSMMQLVTEDSDLILHSEIEEGAYSQPEQDALQSLLGRFPEVFVAPAGLPPSRERFDHQIPLREGTDAINIRPYRYPATQKLDYNVFYALFIYDILCVD